jgi:hypothetical protein
MMEKYGRFQKHMVIVFSKVINLMDKIGILKENIFL